MDILQSVFRISVSATVFSQSNIIARHNTVLAHARAYEVYDKKYRSEQNGIIGITLNSGFREAKFSSESEKLVNLCVR